MIDVFFKDKRLLTSSDTFSGGVNLFRNTDKLDKFWVPFTDNQGEADSSANYASDVNHESIATKSVFHVWGSKASDAGIKTAQQIYFEQGVYTISFLARNNGTNLPSFSLELYSDYTDQHTRLPLGTTSANLTNIWQRYSITFRIDQAGTYGGWRLMNWSDAHIPGGSLYFANLKLERGPVATDWCPAPEDYVMKSDKVLTVKNLIQALFSDELVNIVDDSFDMNNASPGIYRSWGKKPINTPNQCLAWAKYFVIPFIEGDPNNLFQIAIDTNENMFIRTRGGSPAVWNPWHSVNLG